jgi:large subunit ribosomal protein L35Ae
MVKGKVVQFRRGRHTIHERHFLIEVPTVDSREQAGKLVGKEVTWISPGKLKKAIVGKIAAAHGNNGVVRAIFEKGLPGQAIGTEVEIK